MRENTSRLVSLRHCTGVKWWLFGEDQLRCCFVPSHGGPATLHGSCIQPLELAVRLWFLACWAWAAQLLYWRFLGGVPWLTTVFEAFSLCWPDDCRLTHYCSTETIDHYSQGALLPLARWHLSVIRSQGCSVGSAQRSALVAGWVPFV